MSTYCLKCRGRTECKNKKQEDKSGKLFQISQCASCGTKKSRILGTGKSEPGPRKPRRPKVGAGQMYTKPLPSGIEIKPAVKGKEKIKGSGKKKDKSFDEFADEYLAE